MLKFLKLITLGIFLMAFLNSCDSKKNDQMMLVLTSLDNPPYSFMDSKTGEIQGFEMDLIREIAARLKMEIQIKDTAFSGLIPALHSGKGDLAIATLSKTETREKEVDFSTDYHQSIPTVISKSVFDFRTFKDLKAKRVGVQMGSSYDIALKNAVLEEPNFNVTLSSMSVFGELIQELKKDKIDLIITEGVVAQKYATQGFNSLPLMDQKIDSFCAAFPKKSVLLPKFNEVLEALKQEGFVDLLVRKWLTHETLKIAIK